VTVPRVKESTALGAAIFAGIGAGIYRDVASAAKQVVGHERTLEPDAKTHDRYRALYEDWRRLYDAQLALVEQGIVTPLWRAAGT
jgi:autoinducer 2 (AI-2) kinase